MEEIGKLLKEKRLELGLTIEEVSEKTRLTQKHIKALEEGDIHFFHDDLSYLRFFVKSYCEVLGIDFEEIKDDLRKDVNDYTMTFVTSAQLDHDEMEKNIANSEKLTKVQKTSVKLNKKRRFKKPDMSFVSLIAIVAVVAIILMFAFVVFLRSDANNDRANTNQPVAPEQTGEGTNQYPTTKEEEQETQQEEEKKEVEITKTGITNYTIENLKENDELTFEVTFAGSSSAFSASVDGKVLEEPEAKIYDYQSTAKGTVTVKPGMMLELDFGWIYNTQIKINGKNVKLDDSIVESNGSATIQFVIEGDASESAE